MSETIESAQEAFWDEYKSWCLENKVPATYDGFSIWLDDSDLGENYE